MEKYFSGLEKRFGKARHLGTVPARFGERYFNGIMGWQFPEEKILEANREGRLLTMDLDFPGERCALNCSYCFAKAGEKTGTYYRPDKGHRPLSLEEIKRLLLEAKELGLESAKVIGYREPFDNPGIYDFIDFAAEQGIHLVIFTSAYTLGEEHFKGNLQKAIDFLAERPVSLMIKMHTLNDEKEDRIVGLPGFAKKRDYYLKALLDDGKFISETPTRLGIENVIATQNSRELLTMYKYFKVFRNVFVDLDPPIPVGRTGTLEEAEKAGLMGQKRLKELCIETYRINKRHGIAFEGVSPYFGGPKCSQLPNGLYLTLSGQVFTCCGGDECIGNVREKTLKEIFAQNPHRKKECVYHSCPYREKRGMMTEEFVREAESEINQGKRESPRPKGRGFGGSTGPV